MFSFFFFSFYSLVDIRISFCTYFVVKYMNSNIRGEREKNAQQQYNKTTTKISNLKRKSANKWLLLHRNLMVARLPQYINDIDPGCLSIVICNWAYTLTVTGLAKYILAVYKCLGNLFYRPYKVYAGDSMRSTHTLSSFFFFFFCCFASSASNLSIDEWKISFE